MQIIRKLIANDAINGTKLRLDNAEYLKARNAANSANVNVLRLRSDDEVELATITRHNFTPTDASHLVNLSYLQDYVAGIRDPKDAVRAASTANLALTGGATLTVDGVSMANGDRLLLKDQTAGAENGIYVVSGIGSTYALTRSSDANVSAEVTQGMSADVVEGTVNGQTRWLLTTAAITLDTTSLTFVKVPTGAASVAFGHETFTLSGGDITNQYIELAQEAVANSVQVVFGGVVQRLTSDFTLSVPGSVTRVTFAGDLATGGAVELVASDVLYIQYSYYPV